MKLWHNSEIKRITIIFGVILLITLVLSFIGTNIIIKSYENYFMNYNARILNVIADKYPTLDDEVIDTILNTRKVSDTDFDKLTKYGITKSSLLNSVEAVKSEYQHVFITNMVLMITLSSIFIIVIFIFLYKLYKKISNLNTYALDAMHGDGHFDIIDNGEGELSILKNRLFDITRILKENNELLEKDKAALKRAIADISHQLKTPLTSLYLCNEILYDENDKHQRDLFLGKMKDELERIEWLISSLLKMSKLDSRTIALKSEKIIVSDLIDSTLLSLTSLIDSKNINIVKDGSLDLYLNGDFNWLREALSNVIKNGIEHSSNGGEINISYTDNPLYVELDIKDNGEGIDKSDLPHIFERFYKAKGSSKESVGIGLSLSKAIVNNSNGDIMVKSKKNEYTLFIIKIYKNKF